MHSRFLKFFVSRLFGTLVDTLVIWFLSRQVFNSYTGIYIASPIISFEVATFFNYVVSYVWIWHKQITTKNFRDFSLRFVKYNLSTIIGFAVKMAFLILFERLFKWDVIYCNLAALLISGIVNFLLAEYVVFRKGIEHPIVEGYKIVEKNTRERKPDSKLKF
ncbi:MAG: GtrA family protein [Prolixibacteraceae bacterium]|nr:GtrA family protein [Prolixibacteraceae bacterium]